MNANFCGKYLYRDPNLTRQMAREGGIYIDSCTRGHLIPHQLEKYEFGRRGLGRLGLCP